MTLTGSGADASQNATSAVSPLSAFPYTFLSRNVYVATVNGSGVVTAVRQGETEIIVKGNRQVNESLATAAPSGTDSIQASVIVRAIP